MTATVALLIFLFLGYNVIAIMHIGSSSASFLRAMAEFLIVYFLLLYVLVYRKYLKNGIPRERALKLTFTPTLVVFLLFAVYYVIMTF